MVEYKTKPMKKKNQEEPVYAYQYETSPKKISSEFSNTQKRNTNKKVQAKTTTKKSTKYNHKPLAYIVIGFIMLFTVCYRNSLINETYNKKENLKSQLAEVQKENEQLKVNIESSLNLSSIEKIASEQLGMQKLTNEQKVYVNLQKKDYVEPATEEIIINKNTSIIDKILDGLMKAIK